MVHHAVTYTAPYLMFTFSDPQISRYKTARIKQIIFTFDEHRIRYAFCYEVLSMQIVYLHVPVLCLSSQHGDKVILRLSTLPDGSQASRSTRRASTSWGKISTQIYGLLKFGHRLYSYFLQNVLK